MSEHNRKASFLAGRAGSLRFSRPYRIGAIVFTILVATLLIPRTSSVEGERNLGTVWSDDTVRAPFAFPIYRNEATYETEVQRARASVLPVFVPAGPQTVHLSDTLRDAADRLAADTVRPAWLSERSWQTVQGIPAGQERQEVLRLIASTLSNALETTWRSGVIDRDKASITSDRITVRRSTVYEETIPLTQLYDTLAVVQMLDGSLLRTLPIERSLVALDFYRGLVPATLRYSSALTDQARDEATSSVPRTLGIVRQGEIIVATGERITEEVRRKFASYRHSWSERGEREEVWWQVLGNLGHTAIVIGLAMLYLVNFRPRIFRDNLQVSIILLAMLLMATMSWLSIAIHSTLPLEYLIAVPMVSMLLAILFDSRTAFYTTVTCCLLVAATRGGDYAVAIASLSGGVLAAYTVRDIKSRTQLFRSIAFSLLGYAVAIIALGLERNLAPAEMGMKLILAGINALVSPVLTFALILLIERLFDVATDLRLLEYDTLNHPLLRALADRAPGTYQHTLTIARLAESAASAIGANALLAKVGAYYHDIGKVDKAEYFVENQMQMGNKHDKLKPERSAKIIRQHVAEGLELALKYNLPHRIADFIPMHHGTTVISYFYDKAREQGGEVNEADFRYPGPRPQTREAAIVMLADGVEASTRALPNPTPKAIEETIERIIRKRFTDGQLDECDLTLADLTAIRRAFLKNLIGMSHPRIQYQGEERGKPKPTVTDAASAAPMIPYIDDAFGNVDTDLLMSRGEKREGGAEQKSEERG